MQYVAAALAVVSAVGEYTAGQSKKKMYDLEAKKVTVEAARKSLQFKEQGNKILENRAKANAALAARGYAGGVDPFSGSPDIIRRANDTAAGREYQISLEAADAALRGGAIQAQIYEAAGDQAGRAGAFSAVSKLAMAAANASGGQPTTQSPAPIYNAGSAPTTAPGQ